MLPYVVRCRTGGALRHFSHPRWRHSARELFGLSPGFTKAQLRAAWLRLARELHPDCWSSAGPAVRKMKEAALMRVNAARHKLAPQAL
jgi:hypothetical protein